MNIGLCTDGHNALMPIAGRGFLLLLAVGCLSSRTETLALYTCEEGVVGQPVERLVNQANPGVYDGLAYVNEISGGGNPGNMPCYTNNVAGNCIYSDAMYTQIVVRTPLAIHFSSAYSDLASGGSIDLKGLARALHSEGRNRFTIELFWRPDENEDPRLGTIVSFNDWFRGRLATGAYGDYIAMYNRTGYKIYHLGQSQQLRFQGWRHWAITVDASSESKGIGCIYYDYVKKGEQTDFVNGNDQNPDVRIGATLWDADGTRNGGGCARGQIACIRVSDEVLGPDEFMRMGVSAFYPFADGAPGEEVSTVTNSIVAGDSTGTAGCLNKMPVFSSDRPGRYVFAAADKRMLIGSDIQSVEFVMKDQWAQSHGFIDFAGLAGRLLMNLRPNSGAMIECFFKRNGVNWGNLNVLAMDTPSAIGDKVSVRINSDNVVADTRYSYDTSRKSTECSNYGERFFDDGRWHHLAIVIGGTDKDETQYRGVTVYVDYFKNASAAPGWLQYTTNYRWDGWYDFPLTLGHYAGHMQSKNGFIGKVAALRVSPIALSPDRFMVASDTLDETASENLIQWRFDEGTDGTSATSVASAVNVEAWTVGSLTAFGADAEEPRFSSMRTARRMRVCDALFANRSSVRTMPSAAANGVTIENRTWCGIPQLHPKSWTMEAFVMPDASSRTAEAFLFGRGRVNPTSGECRYDWAVALQPDGHLSLKGYRSGDENVPFAFDCVGASLENGRWHRVVVTYDGDDMRYNVWIDDAKVLDIVLDSAQVDGLDCRYQLAAGGGFGGFGGYLDEVRFVGRMLDKNEFTVPSPRGTSIVVR